LVVSCAGIGDVVEPGFTTEGAVGVVGCCVVGGTEVSIARPVLLLAAAWLDVAVKRVEVGVDVGVLAGEVGDEVLVEDVGWVERAVIELLVQTVVRSSVVT